MWNEFSDNSLERAETGRRGRGGRLVGGRECFTAANFWDVFSAAEGVEVRIIL